MADVTWLGDEDASIETIVQYGYAFTKGVATEVPDNDPNMGKFKGNPFFSVAKKEKPAEKLPEPEDQEVATLKAELEAMNVEYRKNASVESLRKLYADALKG